MKSVPTASKLLSRIWREREEELHLKNLKEAKSQIVIEHPTRYSHLQRKHKKAMLLEGMRVGEQGAKLNTCRTVH